MRLDIFTRGEEIDGVEPFGYDRGGAKWGRVYLKNEDQLETVVSVTKESYRLIREAIKNNETTGWFAEPNEEDGEEDTQANNVS